MRSVIGSVRGVVAATRGRFCTLYTRAMAMAVLVLLAWPAVAGAASSCPNWSMNPSLPGSKEGANLLGGLAFDSMLACGAGLMIGVITHQFAKHTRRPELAHHSLHAAGWALGGAVLSGGAHQLIGSAHQVGTAIGQAC